MVQPRVSIAVIAYNQFEYITETLSSAINQNYDNLEVVVADDYSSDGTQDIIRDFIYRYPKRLKGILGQHNLGVTGNSNRALNHCNGEYVAFLGGDDVLLPEKITQQVALMDSDERIALSGHDVGIFDSTNGQVISNWSQHNRLTSGNGASNIVRYGVPYPATSIMVRRSRIPTKGFDERLRVASDWLMWIECVGASGLYDYIDGVYARYRISSQNVSKKYSTMIEDKFITLALVENQFPLYLKHVRAARSRLYYQLGINYLRSDDVKTARNLFFKSLTTSFTAKKSLPAYFLTFFPRIAIELVQDRNVPRTNIDWIKFLINIK